MVVPLLLVARSFSHCVQFIERYYEIYEETGDRHKSAELALRVLMAPGALGIVTDATGFSSSLSRPSRSWTLCSFLRFWALILVPANLFLSPILLSWFPAPKNVKTLLGKEEGAKFHRAVVNLLEKFQN